MNKLLNEEEKVLLEIIDLEEQSSNITNSLVRAYYKEIFKLANEDDDNIILEAFEEIKNYNFQINIEDKHS